MITRSPSLSPETTSAKSPFISPTFTAVKVGEMNGLFAEVVSGLKEGDLVITNVPDEVDDGVRVRRRRAGSARNGAGA